ncbi:MAG: hypothetical protein AB1Z67_10785 [Candidatus Limnocylindrales bacterium]
MGRPEGAPRDRLVVLIVAAVVVGLLAFSVVSALIPDIDGTLAAVPLIIVVLVVGTVLVLARSLRGAGR